MRIVREQKHKKMPPCTERSEHPSCSVAAAPVTAAAALTASSLRLFGICLFVGLAIVLAACNSGAGTIAPASPVTAVLSGVHLTPESSSGALAQMAQAGELLAAAGPQVSAGQQVYSQHCAVCHGASLQGASGPPLSRTTLASFGTASALFDYVSKQMPLTAPGSLTQQQYYDVVAYIMDTDGLLPANTTLTPQNATSISLTGPPTPQLTGTVTATATATPQPAVVQVAQIPSVGYLLVDSQGHTLYHNSNDGPDKSTCVTSCALAWTPLSVPAGVTPTKVAQVPGTLGIFQRPDGTYQVTYTDPPQYDRVPLYTYFADKLPGDRNGAFVDGIWADIVFGGMGPSMMATGTPMAGQGPGLQAGQGVAAMGVADYLQNCSPCHGNRGQGVDAPPLRNSQYVQTAGDAAIFQTIVQGVPGTEMPAWLLANGGPLTAVQISNVVAYLHTLQGVTSLPPSTPAPPEPTPTPAPPGAPTPVPARPSMPGGPGPAATLTGNVDQGRPMFGDYCAICHGPEGVQGVANPDSDDESVPALNPIDPTIANPDPKVFALNVDLFIEHGSVPEGEGPLLVMPPFGDSKMLTQQQIADLIVYVMSLNGVQ